MKESTLVILFATAAWWDWRFRKVPNLLVLGIGISGFLVQLTSGEGWLACKGVTVAFVLTLLPVVLHRMGMGDQKLLMAVGAWVGEYQVYHLFLLALLLSILPVLLTPHRWGILYHNIYTLASGWVGHRRLWLPTTKESAHSLPFAVSLGFSYCLLLVGEGLR